MRSLAVIAAFAAASALDLSAPAIHHDLVNEINQAGLTWKAGACHDAPVPVAVGQPLAACTKAAQHEWPALAFPHTDAGFRPLAAGRANRISPSAT